MMDFGNKSFKTSIWAQNLWFK
ncbi:hypothetical protein Zm00014a_038774 [Zea mays]|uniref:Uncharacterized protein n=1 Tax=Zea mays TaxID=4577 RepID=A0A3L6DXL9_MAIZE|nr:hypothetical protein Zm00014a_038774 [Zea mays]